MSSLDKDMMTGWVYSLAIHLRSFMVVVPVTKISNPPTSLLLTKLLRTFESSREAILLVASSAILAHGFWLISFSRMDNNEPEREANAVIDIWKLLNKPACLDNGFIYEDTTLWRRPGKNADGTYVFAAPPLSSAVPFICLEDIGHYARWIFDSASESIGLNLKAATERAGYPYLAETITAVTITAVTASLHGTITFSWKNTSSKPHSRPWTTCWVPRLKARKI
jgi:hypothetical protein